MIDALFMGPTATAVAEALRAAGTDRGEVAVVGPVRLGRALGERGYEVVQIVDKPRTRLGAIARQVHAAPENLPLAEGELAAVVARGGHQDDWQRLVGEWQRVIADGGALVLVARAAAHEMARRALCSGLAGVEQRRIGGQVITSGAVIKV
ncbi:hypothetical protein [Haliangium ochraceum]|uniref:hypothetical protein n=1 Tax=Haliangium ochraceum TaxID=80816 RepID=UPI00019BA6DA|nr:hypothetical protein [Haliangium ochraceum]